MWVWTGKSRRMPRQQQMRKVSKRWKHLAASRPWRDYTILGGLLQPAQPAQPASQPASSEERFLSRGHSLDVTWYSGVIWRRDGYHRQVQWHDHASSGTYWFHQSLLHQVTSLKTRESNTTTRDANMTIGKMNLGKAAITRPPMLKLLAKLVQSQQSILN